MPLLFAFVIGISALMGLESVRYGIPPDQRQMAQQQISYQHDLLMTAANGYVKSNPTATGTLTWQTLRRQVGHTAGSDNIPSTWRVEVYAPGKFVVCTKGDSAVMDELMFAMNSRGLKDVVYMPNPTKSDVMVAGASRTDTEANLSLCN